MQSGFDETIHIQQRVLRNLHLPLRRCGEMRKPIDVGKQQSGRRNATGRVRQHRMECAIGRTPLPVQVSIFAGEIALHAGALIFIAARSLRWTGQDFRLWQGRYRPHSYGSIQCIGFE